MKRDPRLLRVLAGAAGLALLAGAGGLALAAALLRTSLPAHTLDTTWAQLQAQAPLLLLVLGGWMGLAMAGAQFAYRRWLAPPAQLLEQAQVLLHAHAPLTLPAPAAEADASVHGLARVLGELHAQRQALQQDVAAQVGAGTQALALERRRLAALMHELQQGVIVCNRDGRILLYNRRARLQFQLLVQDSHESGTGVAAGAAPGQHLIGLGRSIYAVLEPAQLAHALAHIQQRRQRGAESPVATFVTSTRGGQLLRVQVAAVAEDMADAMPGPNPSVTASTPPASPASTPADEPAGFVLMLDNITRAAERASAHATELHELAETLRAGLAQAAADTRQLQTRAPAADAQAAELTARLLAQVQGLAARLQALDRQAAEQAAARWPREDMQGADLVSAALLRLQALNPRASLLEVDDTLWLHVDSFSLLQLLEHLARRLQAEFDDDPQPLPLQLRLQAASDAHAPTAFLDLVWPGRAMSGETVLAWETEPLQTDGQRSSPMTVRDVLHRHGTSLSFERDRLRQQACFRLRLQCVAAPGGAPAPAPAQSLSPAAVTATAPGVAGTGSAAGARPAAEPLPVSYDFELFDARPLPAALDDCALSELVCTVFDTETTGLAPLEGDQILQIGAVRVLRGRVLWHEAYEQLVDPQRPIPAAGIPIHGITPAMVQGQPRLEQVLPVFHAYAADTVLVAHNAAFDLRFLQLAEARCGGLRFDHPVLDTLLLSAVVHPQQASHRLEHIAERFGVNVVGRHTALGDALVTAQIFVRLLPLLAAQGVHTLAQAREASRRTYYATLKY